MPIVPCGRFPGIQRRPHATTHAMRNLALNIARAKLTQEHHHQFGKNYKPRHYRDDPTTATPWQPSVIHDVYALIEHAATTTTPLDDARHIAPQDITNRTNAVPLSSSSSSSALAQPHPLQTQSNEPSQLNLSRTGKPQNATKYSSDGQPTPTTPASTTHATTNDTATTHSSDVGHRDDGAVRHSNKRRHDVDTPQYHLASITDLPSQPRCARGHVTSSGRGRRGEMLWYPAPPNGPWPNVNSGAILCQACALTCRRYLLRPNSTNVDGLVPPTVVPMPHTPKRRRLLKRLSAAD